MKKKLPAIALITTAIALVIGLVPVSSSMAQEPPQPTLISAAPTGPTAGTMLTGGLLSPRGLKMGPDGMIYVAEAGTGGDIAATAGGHSGNTGRISKIDPATGARTTVAANLPSNAGDEGDAVGPADVAFIGNQLYYVQTHAGADYGFPATTPTGVYKVNANGTVTLLADIGAFNKANPVTPLKNGSQQDIEAGGNPYAMDVRNGALYITDGNQNQVLKVTTAGVITRIADFPQHVVTTGIAASGSGPFYVGALGTFPFAPADGRVYSVGDPTGSITQVASGYSSVTDVEMGPGGALYALTFGDQATDPNAPAPWAFNSGKILKVNTSTGQMSVVVDGFMFTAAMIFSGDTAYISNGSVSIPGLVDGQIWKIANFSTVTPPAPVPTAAPTTAPPAPTATPAGGTGGITAPNTGSGGQAAGSSDNGYLTLVLLGIAGAAIVATGTGMLWKRSQ